MKKILLPHQFYFPYLDIARERATHEKLNEFAISLGKSAPRKSLIYVHLPFCNSECSFCGFDKAYDLAELSRYIDALKSEIDHYAGKPYVLGLEITGIHIGGGTPSLLPEDILGDLIDNVRNRFRADHVPLNIECSPVTLHDGMIGLLKEKKISRVSVGVQTFDPVLRRHLNILSSLDDTLEALTHLKRAGIITYVDIMYGFPDLGTGNPLETVESDVNKAIALGVDGVDFSQYYPFHNPLAQRISKQGLPFPTSEDLVKVILSATSVLESSGYVQATEYLFCNKGEILLEKAYFGESDCIAVGSGSLGLINGYKYRNKRYAQYLKSEVPAILSLRKLTEDELQRIPIVGFPRLLRLPKNILSEQMKERYGDKLRELIDMRMLEETSDSFVLTNKGKAFINNIYFMMMEEAEQKEIERQLKILRLQ
ncbi:MAG TPA: radical SAM protein [Thermodesulfovibrionales bacterium]|nr:radical SAM protein [Thermodesulfovibrionales bacterium]